MADDKKNNGAQDRARINIHEDYELRDWSKSLGVSKETLIAAVEKVGVSAEKVKEYLKDHKGRS